MLGGMTSYSSIVLSIFFIIFVMEVPPYFNISAVMVSGPGAFLFGRDFISILTSLLVSCKLIPYVRSRGGPSYSPDQYL
jgi:hypothetical protein